MKYYCQVCEQQLRYKHHGLYECSLSNYNIAHTYLLKVDCAIYESELIELYNYIDKSDLIIDNDFENNFCIISKGTNIILETIPFNNIQDILKLSKEDLIRKIDTYKTFA